ncbi:MAG TPA: hypothetical protein VLQ90_07080 [Pyrinomonadaceae bacterium]|nr:hypothetical protein [Pyrinomonadaceae bacterium]
MPATRKRSQAKPKRSELSEPDVIVDFIFADGLFFIAVSNISDRPAYKVSVKFDGQIYGLGGKDICALPLFGNIEFLAPHKTITTFLDSSGSYFSSGGPTKISARITYHDFRGTKKVATIRHDLEIYREIGFIRRPDSQD